MDKWNRHGLVIATALAFLAILGLGWPGAVGTDDEHMLAALQTVARQPMGYLPDHGVQVGPIQGLPDTVFFFAQRGIARALARMFLK